MSYVLLEYFGFKTFKRITKEHRTAEEEMEGPTSSWGLRNRLTRLNLHERDDDDDNDDL
jgi:hypothetical protein